MSNMGSWPKISQIGATSNNENHAFLCHVFIISFPYFSLENLLVYVCYTVHNVRDILLSVKYFLQIFQKFFRWVEKPSVRVGGAFF